MEPGVPFVVVRAVKLNVLREHEAEKASCKDGIFAHSKHLELRGDLQRGRGVGNALILGQALALPKSPDLRNE